MIKSFLVTTSAPFCGTDTHYAAFAENEDSITDWLYANWFEEECQRLWDDYSFHCESEWEAEWDETSDEDKKEFYDNSYENFMNQKNEEWCNDCGLSVEEMSEEKLEMYSIGGNIIPDIIYDERNKD